MSDVDVGCEKPSRSACIIDAVIVCAYASTCPFGNYTLSHSSTRLFIRLDLFKISRARGVVLFRHSRALETWLSRESKDCFTWEEWGFFAEGIYKIVRRRKDC